MQNTRGWLYKEITRKPSFDERLNELKLHVKKYGVMPSRKTNTSLFNWMHGQRKMYNKNKLKAERVEILKKDGVLS